MTTARDEIPDWTRQPLGPIPDAPGMLAPDERRLLYVLARDWYRGDGKIVDAGAFLGASAAALAAGLRDNREIADKTGRITSYDLFEYFEFCAPYLEAGDWEIGDDVLPAFRENLGGLSYLVEPVKGDICAQRWTGGPIELLFVDFTQNWQHDDFVIKEFYPHLIPGRSVLIHQDYIYTLCYWLHVFMERYADCFEQISPLVPNSSAVWRLAKPLPDEVFELPSYRLTPVPRMLELLERSMERYRGVPRGLLEIARIRLLLHAYGAERAREAYDALRRPRIGESALESHRKLVESEIDALVGQPPPLASLFDFG